MILLTGCSTAARDAAPFQGTWESEGLGLYLDVHGGDADVYEHTAVHCALVYGGPARGISDVLAFEGDRLVLTDSGRVIHFDAIPVLPAVCAGPFASTDSAGVVEVAAASVEELYVPGVDPEWAARLSGSIAGLEGVTDPGATFDALTNLLTPLGNPGVRLAVDDPTVWDGIWSAGGGPFVGLEPYTPAYLEDPAISGDGGIVTGRFGTVGYVGLARLGGFAEDDAGSQRVLAAEVDGVLAGSTALVLDLRGASSGRSVEAMLVASRFVDTQRLVVTQMVGDVPAGEVSVTPTAQGPYSGDVVVLVGPGTAGAAELLVLALRDLPAVTVMGEPTAGSPSPPLARSLPNGWSLGVPALDVVSPDGARWAGVPLVPSVSAPITGAELNDGSDPGIVVALRLLG
jgi:hypothetical protein